MPAKPAAKAESKPDSIYKVVELVGTSDKSWDDALAKIIATASKSLRELRVAEVVRLDVKVRDQKVAKFRARVKVSFKYEGN
jgi:flavin-binding protein dodecin